MTRLRVLLLLALIVGAAGVALTVATARGWEAVGPADVPLSAYAPTDHGADAYDTTLDSGEFEVEGTRYAAEIAGPSRVNGSGAYYTVTIVRVGGEGGRIAIANATLRDASNATIAHGAPTSRDDALQVVLDAPLAKGAHTLAAEVVVRGYRDAAWGAWHTDDVVLRFGFDVEVA